MAVFGLATALFLQPVHAQFGPTNGAQWVRDNARPQAVSKPSGAVDKAPGALTQSFLNGLGVGGKVWLLAGTHTVSGDLVPLEGQVIAAQAGAIITGSSSTSRIIRDNTTFSPNVQILGGTYTGFGGSSNEAQTAHSAIFAGVGWLIQDVTFDGNYNRGLTLNGANGTARRCRLTNNGRYGVAGSGVGALIEHCEVASNNTRQLGPGGDAGAMKFGANSFSSSIIRNNWFHNNYGFGVWYDNPTTTTICTGLIVEGNVCENNLLAGIFLEGNEQSLVSRNYLIGNGYGDATYPQTIFNGWQILVSCADSTKVSPADRIEITLNIVDGTDDGTPPPHPFLVGFINHDVHPDDTKGVNIHHNQFWIRGTGQAVGGADTQATKTLWTEPTITVDYNEYHVLSTANENWRWLGDPPNTTGEQRTWAEWQAEGFDLNSTRVVIGALTITTTSLPSGLTSVSYGSQQLAATGGVMPYTWSIISGTLPAGLSLSSGGIISGTPSAAGTSNFTVRATDTVGGFDDQALSITIYTGSRFEAESLTATTSSGDVRTQFSDANMSAGFGDKLNADAVSDFISYSVNVASAGTYTVVVGAKKQSSRGICQLAVDGTNHGAAQDHYSSADSYVQFNLGDKTFSTSGVKQFKFTITGKNASSSGYTLGLDYIDLILVSTPPPAAPSNLTATKIDYKQINLSWSNVANEVGYKIERKKGAGGTYSQIGTTGVDVTTYSDTTCGSGTTYYYRVRAYNASGDSAFSNEANATTDEITTGRRGHWKLDETSGTTAADSSGNSNTGTTSGGPTWTAGKIANGLNLDGVDDKVNAGSGTTLDNLAAITVAAWIKADTMGGGGAGRIVDKGVGASRSAGWKLRIQGTEELRFTVKYATTDLERISVANAFATGGWYHVLATWTGSATATNAKIYVNGVEVSYATTTNGSGTRDNDGANSLYLGNESGGTRGFDGILDDVRVYNRVLTAAEILAVYRAGL